MPTEDDAHGGLDAVLSAELARYSLPPEAGLTGLLRHIYGNRDTTMAFKDLHIQTLQYRIAQVRAVCTEAEGDTREPDEPVVITAAVRNAIRRKDNSPPEGWTEPDED